MQTYTNCYYGDDLIITKKQYVTTIKKMVINITGAVWCTAGRDSSTCFDCNIWLPKNFEFQIDIPPEIDEYEENLFPDQDFTELDFD